MRKQSYAKVRKPSISTGVGLHLRKIGFAGAVTSTATATVLAVQDGDNNYSTHTDVMYCH